MPPLGPLDAQHEDPTGRRFAGVAPSAGEQYVSQTGLIRCAVEGQLIDGGGACTVVLIRERGGWVLYPHGATGMAVYITGHGATKVATTILGDVLQEVGHH